MHRQHQRPRHTHAVNNQETSMQPNTDNVSVLTIHLSSEQKPFKPYTSAPMHPRNATNCETQCHETTAIKSHLLNTSSTHQTNTLSVRQIDVHHNITTKTAKRTFSTQHAGPNQTFNRSITPASQQPKTCHCTFVANVPSACACLWQALRRNVEEFVLGHVWAP